MSRSRNFQGESFHELWWADVPIQWPLRLLHIPTMTSIERTGENTYGVDKEPEYCVLTYTWGRFRADWGCPALNVKGTTWKIPSVKESCFTVEAFHRVIQVMGYETDYAWVDIACIDQEDNEMKMHEVGRQVGIFKGAKGAFVWLHSLGNMELKSVLHTVFEFGPQTDMINSDFQTVAATLQLNLKRLFDDPWFTSLWTLQESVLRRDAVILSRDARPIPHPWMDNLDISLTMLANMCRNICLDVERGRTRKSLKHESPEAEDLISRIQEAGFEFLVSSNPNVQYAAAGFRQTVFPLDRIYGIMQIYGIAVGEAAGAGRTVNSVEELEDEFTAVLNERLPIVGQAFIHKKSSAEGRSWRITQQSRVPMSINDIYGSGKNTRTNCTILKNPGNPAATVTGLACSLQRLEQFWQRLPGIATAKEYGSEVMLDYDAIVLSHGGENFKDFEFDYSYRKTIAVKTTAEEYEACKRLISSIPAADLQVILLGTMLEDFFSDFGEQWESFVGLIVHRDARSAGWRRMGICCWGLYPSSLPPMELPVWEDINIELY